MKRRFCSRRFIGFPERGGRLGRSWRLSTKASQPDSDHADPKSSASCPFSRRRIRFRLAMFAAILMALGLSVAHFGLPSHSQSWRFPGDRYATPSLDQLITWDSFSEVEQTKGILRGLSLQAMAEIRRAYLRSRSEPVSPPDTLGPLPTPDPALATAVDRVRRRLEEFQGTEHTTLFQGELLRLLRKEGRHAEWLDLYLQLIYQQPGDPLIIMEAPRAADAAKATGREAEWHDALDHWNQIPTRYRASLAGSEPRIPEPILP